MPEGPSLVIFREAVSSFTGKKILEARGNAKISMERLQGQKIRDIRTWGKQLFICLQKTTIRVHFLLFGSCSIGEQTKPARSLRLGLIFSKGAIYFYSCSVKLTEGSIDTLYDWEADVMSDKWNPARARKKLKLKPQTKVCDALLDQEIFSGVGNIIKNEVLYRTRIHPDSLVGKVPPARLTAMIREARNYSFDFLQWKKAFVLKKHWLVHTKKICQRCEFPVIKKYCGSTRRRTFYCDNCQVKYK